MPAGSSSSSWRSSWPQSGSQSSRRPRQAARARPRFEAIGEPVVSGGCSTDPQAGAEAGRRGVSRRRPLGVLRERALSRQGTEAGRNQGRRPTGRRGTRRAAAAGARTSVLEGQLHPVLLDEPSEHSRLVEEFDKLAELYEVLVRPFWTPIFEEALAVIHRYLAPDSRVLDAGCGPGRELRRVAGFLPGGEAV